MEEYTLYLDESKNKEKTLFLICGVIVKNSNIEHLNKGIYNVKKCIWDEKYIRDNHPVLHCVELTTVKDSRGNKKFLSSYFDSHPTYSILFSKSNEEIKNIYESIYSNLCKSLKDADCVTIGCLIDREKFKYIYGNNIYPKEELLFEIAIQEIVENYAHFLQYVHGVGNIIYESRNDEFALTEKSADFKMYQNFCKIKACNKGITFANQELISKTIRYFYIHNKKDDIPGLQMADFVAYNILQSMKRTELQCTEFMKKISDRLYNGGFQIAERDLRNYFGLKQLPYDFQYIHNLESEKATIKKANENIKEERNNLLKKNNLLREGKNKLLKQNESLKAEIVRLKEELSNAKANIDNSI